MKEIKNDIIKKFKHDNYVIYIKDNNDYYESYIQNEDYSIINLMFGVSKKQNTLEEFINNIESNIKEHIEQYKDDIED